jgi:hypothetical protein
MPTALGNEVRAAAKGFRAVAPEALPAAKAELQQAAAALDAYLSGLGSWGPPWKDYLYWDAMTKELAKAGDYDVAALQRVQRRYSGGFTGLEEPEFQAVGKSLAKFAYAADTAQNKNLAADTAAHLNALADTTTPWATELHRRASATIAENVTGSSAQPGIGSTAQLAGRSRTRICSSTFRDVRRRRLESSTTKRNRSSIAFSAPRSRHRPHDPQVNVDIVPNTERCTATHLRNSYSRRRPQSFCPIYSQGQTTLSAIHLFVNEQGLAGPIQTCPRRQRITGYSSTKGASATS